MQNMLRLQLYHQQDQSQSKPRNGNLTLNGCENVFLDYLVYAYRETTETMTSV